MDVLFKGIDKRGYNFLVTVNGHQFEYFQGFGHITTKKTKYKLEPVDDMKVNASILNVIDTSSRKQYLEVGKQAFNDLSPSKRYYIKEPDLMDVLHCLHSDAECGRYTFEEFCDNLGYVSDSRNAFDIYMKCQDTANKLRGFEFPEVIINGEY